MSSGITARIIVVASFTIGALPARAQTAADGALMPRRTLAIGVTYARDRWDHYWEGTLNRTNDNLGTVTTQTATVSAMYGVTDHVSVVASLPHVSTRASQGPLHGMSGLQDASIGARYRVLTTPFTKQGTLTVLVAAIAELPASTYSPDFLPLSIGLGSKCFTSRLTMHFQSNGPWFITGTAAHSWRDKVTLDRTSYFSDGQLYLSNEVAMPRVADGMVIAGIHAGQFTIPLSLSQHRTLGGGDIRRQDMPFTSNRMNATRMGGAIVYTPVASTMPAFRLGVARTVDGRNVGQSTTYTVGSAYAIHF